MRQPMYQRLASLVDARKRSWDKGNVEWKIKHETEINRLCKEFMPHGSGFDSGTTLDLDASTEDKLVFCTSFHHMNEHGYYDGWTEHTVTVRASLTSAYSLKVGGRDRNEIKDFIGATFRDSLDTVEEAEIARRAEYKRRAEEREAALQRGEQLP
jgi:hypothetical protein